MMLMIINTGNRTDIPAYYSQWFYQRIKEGYVLVRNPYDPEQVLKYKLRPDVVDIICFCTKNPKPMLARMSEIKDFGQFWFVTITPYGTDIEPNVPAKEKVMDSFRKLSDIVGVNAVSWRYDPIFISEKYTLKRHLEDFEKMAENLKGYTRQCVISFIDLYAKTRRNFPKVREVSWEEQEIIAKEFVKIGKKYNMKILACCERSELSKHGIDVSGCMTKSILEKAVGCTLDVPKKLKSSRPQCDCLLGSDIGMYNTCGHACLYCYANYERRTVVQNMKRHHPQSPFLIGELQKNDKIKEVKQKSWLDGQLSFLI